MTKTIALMFVLVVGLAGSAQAGSETCRDWLREHAEWKSKVLGRYLGDAPQRKIDEAVFELMQREAYLTSCPTKVRALRPHMVGWRLVDRDVDGYAAAVIESILEEGGLDLDLRARFEGVGSGSRHAGAIAPR
jgi:hypothetical protein